MKCDYKGCSRQCCGDVNDEICNVLRAYHQGKAEEREKVIKECKEVLRHYAFKEDDDNMYIKVGDLEQLKEQAMVYRSIEISTERALKDVFKQAKIEALVHSFKTSATVEAIIDTTKHDEEIRADERRKCLRNAEILRETLLENLKNDFCIDYVEKHGVTKMFEKTWNEWLEDSIKWEREHQ